MAIGYHSEFLVAGNKFLHLAHTPGERNQSPPLEGRRNDGFMDLSLKLPPRIYRKTHKGRLHGVTLARQSTVKPWLWEWCSIGRGKIGWTLGQQRQLRKRLKVREG